MSSVNLVLDGIKDLQLEFPDGVPVNILLEELDLSDDELKVTLLSLMDDGVIFIEEEYVKLVEQVSENDMVGLDDPVNFSDDIVLIDEEKISDLTERELEGLEIIKFLADDSKRVSKYLLEGHFLYGDLKLSPLGTYNLILSLENKGLIKHVRLSDGEYYIY
ncbi:MAG: hypothetical protein ACLPHE_09880 [Methanobacterium sp.]|jgi:hypothetical protein